MKRVFEFIEEQKNEIYNDPELVRGRQVERGENFDRIPLHRKFDWSPVFIHLAMTFRDINLIYLRYENPKDKYERAINDHVAEDIEHYPLLMHDLKVLGLDERQPLSDAVATVWSDRSIEARKYIYSVMNLAFLCGDNPFLRIACMQANESSVELFFEVTKMNALYFEQKTGVRLEYFGSRHADSELEHALNLEVFTQCDVPDEIVAKGIDIARAHFISFREFFEFKKSVTEDPDEQLARWPEPKIRPPFRVAVDNVTPMHS